MHLRIVSLAIAVAVAALFPSTGQAQRWASVDVGSQHACALDDEGRAYCWGENGSSELGAPTPERCFRNHHGPGQRCAQGPSAAPVAVAGDHRFKSIRAGYAQTCALDLEGRLLCWGLIYGRTPQPVPYARALRLRDVQEIDRTVCGALAEGGGRCWEYRGRLEEDAFLDGVSLSAVDQSAYPGEVTCALAEDGRALCRGDNSYGQLGTGSTGEREGWGEVAGGRRWAELRVAPTWACGRTTEGEAFCWGVRVGPDTGEKCSMDYPCAPGPRPVAGGVRFRLLDRGREEMCGLAEDGTMHCWDTDLVVRPVAAGTRFRTIAGGYHGWCGITLAGDLRCWGWQQGPREPAPVPPSTAATAAGPHAH